LRLDRLEARELLSVVPLGDLGRGTYLGYQGGLYPQGRNTRPPAHEAAGEDIARNQIVPRDASGNVDRAGGRIGMISVGMSNTTLEFGNNPGAFETQANADPSKNRQLVIVNGAQGGQAADAWVNPNAPTWSVVDQRLHSAGVTPLQVEVAWVKEADAMPSRFGAFPNHAQHLQSELAAIARNLVIRYPNIRLAYYSSRTHAFTTDPQGLNPEPYAYESGFSTKWLIADQLNGNPDLNYDPTRGPVVAPYLSWGPYLWANGMDPRSDGFVWTLADVQSDYTHPSPSGVQKVGDQLVAFFKTDPTATPWFLRQDVIGQPPQLTASADVSHGAAPLTVHFAASAFDPDGYIRQYVWTFDDGTYSYDQNPTKIFPDPGIYNAHATVTDNDGNPVTQAVTVRVSPSLVGIPVPSAPPLTIAGPGEPNTTGVLVEITPQESDRSAALDDSQSPGSSQLPRFTEGGSHAQQAQPDRPWRTISGSGSLALPDGSFIQEAAVGLGQSDWASSWII
jgi:hypothetical protein